MSGRELAIWRPDGDVRVPPDAYGRLVANAGAFRALAQLGRLDRLHVQSREPLDPAELSAALGVAPGGPEVTSGPLLAVSAVARAGTLLSGQPYLSEPAWIRRHATADSAYSIVGTVFAFASAPHREQLGLSMLAPLQPWDALICSSPTLLRTVERVLDGWEDHLRERASTSALVLPRPQLPLLPIGSDVMRIGEQSRDAAARGALRSELGIADEEAMVLSLGRLSYLDKAFPQAMLRATQAAQERTGVRAHLVLTGWFPNPERDRPLYLEAVRACAPDVRTTFLDGNDHAVVARCWAAADVFLLLSDTIIETFGQAIVEAMAAGLPIVASDWDGYRWIVRDGVDGFLIPTLGSPGGAVGETLALLEATGQVDYGQYAGATSQHTAVHLPRATQALCALLEQPGLRASMGESGRRRAAELFDWPVVVEQYLGLFDDLRERRHSAGESRSRHRVAPLRGDPFATFSALPSELLGDSTVLRLGSSTPGRSTLDHVFPGVRGSDAETADVLAALAAVDAMTVGDLLRGFAPHRRALVRMTVLWLAKQGCVDWLDGPTPPAPPAPPVPPA